MAVSEARARAYRLTLVVRLCTRRQERRLRDAAEAAHDRASARDVCAAPSAGEYIQRPTYEHTERCVQATARVYACVSYGIVVCVM